MASLDVAHQRLVIEHTTKAASVRDVDLSLDLVDELNTMPATTRSRAKDRVRERVLVSITQPG